MSTASTTHYLQRPSATGHENGSGGWEAWAVAGLTAAVLVLRVTQLHQSLYGDEVLAYREIVHHGLLQTVRIVKGGVESSPPLFFVLAWLSAKLGDPTVWIRLPSLILGTLTIPLVYLIGREAVGRRAGAIGAAVFALSPFSAYYGIEARPYATLAFCLSLSTLSLLRAVRTRHRRWWALYAVAAAASAYAHYTAVFILLVQGIWSLWACRDRLREPVLAAVVAVGLYAPWLPQVHGSVLALYGLLEPLNFTNVSADVLRLVPGYPYATLTEIPSLAGLAVLGAVLGAGLAGAATARRPAFTSDRDAVGGPGLLVALAVATPIGVLLYSVIRISIWDSRDLYASAPAMALLAGWLVASVPRPGRVPAIAASLAVLVAGTTLALSPRYRRPPFRQVAQYLDAHAGPRDPVVLVPFFLNLQTDIPVEFTRPHRTTESLPRRMPQPPPGGSTWVVLEWPKRSGSGPAPRFAGLRLAGVRRYGNTLIPFSLLRYVAAPAPGRARTGGGRVVRPARRPVG